jgi:hypothetical protein
MDDNGYEEFLLGLVCGVLNESDPLTGVDFAVKIAICAKLTGGDQAAYAKAVRKALVGELELTEIFPKNETEHAVRSFLRAVRHARANPAVISWLAKQFEVPQSETRVRDYLIAAERVLSRVFMSDGRISGRFAESR